MIYEIAGLRVQIDNKYEYTDNFCKVYLSEDQTSPVDIVARTTEADIAEEKAQSPDFSDGYVENICLYRSLCLQIPAFDRILLHCAVLEYQGKAYAFLGRSGTGKSTHSRLWKTFLSTPNMVNGDKPILEYKDGAFIAHGTPWKGKEGWGMKTSAPLCGLCFLEQAKVNSIKKLSPAEVSSRLFSQILLPTEEEGVIATLNLVDKLISSTPAFLLQCDISEEAVQLSFEALTGLSFVEYKTNK